MSKSRNSYKSYDDYTDEEYKKIKHEAERRRTAKKMKNLLRAKNFSIIESEKDTE